MTVAAEHVPARRDRSARVERRRRRRRASVIARFVLALGGVVGITAGFTTAVWQDDVSFAATVEVDEFQMEYSFTHALGSWKPFNGSLTLADGVVFEGFYKWMDNTSADQLKHSLFIRNVGKAPTKVIITPDLGAVYSDPGVLTVKAGLITDELTDLTTVPDEGSWEILLENGMSARVLMELRPGNIVPDPDPEPRTAVFTLTIEGSVGAP